MGQRSIEDLFYARGCTGWGSTGRMSPMLIPVSRSSKTAVIRSLPPVALMKRAKVARCRLFRRSIRETSA